MIKYFKVVAKCGHVKKMNYVLKTFAIAAETASSASQYAKKLPRVKKHMKSCIESCDEIDYIEYMKIKKQNALDGYFKSHTHREQMLFCPDLTHEILSIDFKESTKRNEHIRRRMIEKCEFRDMLKYIINEGYVHQSVLKM